MMIENEQKLHKKQSHDSSVNKTVATGTATAFPYFPTVRHQRYYINIAARTATVNMMKGYSAIPHPTSPDRR